MKLSEQVEIAAPLERSWPALQDVDVIAECLPGAEIEGTTSEPNEHQGTLTVQFGPTRATFSGQVRFEVASEDHRVHIEGRGRDQRGRNRASVALAVTASELDEGRTQLEINGDVDVVGPLERFATTGGQHLAQELLHSFAENIATYIERPDDESATPSPEASSPLSLNQLIWRAIKRWLRGS